MGSTPLARRRVLLCSVLAAVLVAIGSLAWIAFASRTPAPGIAKESEPRATERATPTEPATPELVHQPEPVEPAASPALPVPTGRSQIGDTATAGKTIEVVVRTKDEGTPIPRCEVIYFSGEDDVENEFKQYIDRSGFDIEALRRVARHTFAGDDGHALLQYRSGSISALAISPTHCGLETFEIDPASSEERTIECDPMFFVRAQVVDERGDPQAGVPILLARKERSFIDFVLAATTHGPQGLAELGPIESNEDGFLVLRVAGAFPAKCAIELDPKALPPQPIQLVLPDYGSIEVRLLDFDGSRFVGSAEVDLFAAEGETDLPAPPSELVAIGSGSALFPRVGLGLELQAKIRVPGHDGNYEVHGPGPRSAGEKVVLEVKLNPAGLTLVGRVFDVARRPLRFRELRMIGAIKVGRETREFDEQVETDAVGNYAYTIDNCNVERGPATLLLVQENEAHSLGALKSIVVSTGANDLGSWTLEPAPVLASGRALFKNGLDAPGATIELVISDHPMEIGWAEASQAVELGKFELRGWSSESTISILAGSRAAKLREPISVAKGSAGVLLQHP